MRFAAIFITCCAAQTFAASAFQVSCSDCSQFQEIQVLIDGVNMGRQQSIFIENIAPGRHEMKVVKWFSPFSARSLYVGYVDFPDRTVLRAKALEGRLDIYGRSDYGPPPPPPPAERASRGEQGADASAWLDEAREHLGDLQERVVRSGDECAKGLSARLGALADALDDARARVRRRRVDAAEDEAAAAQELLETRCRRHNARHWGQSLERVLRNLRRASRELKRP